VEAVYLTFIFMLAVLLGVELINKVPATLHTPLMSGSNAISGITLVGALISSTTIAEHETITAVLATAAVFLATINVVGDYVVTDRMLAMFKKTPGGK
jgi:NAD(P) transhydrogenase subunit alpha